MDETGQRSLRIESLNPTHLARWPDLIDGDDLPRFQEFLLGDWLSRFEQRFPDLIPSRSPRCLVAVEADRVVASEFSPAQNSPAHGSPDRRPE